MILSRSACLLILVSCRVLTRGWLERLQEIVQTAWDNGINMLDCAESYSGGENEIAMYVNTPFWIRSVRLMAGTGSPRSAAG